MMTSGDRSMVVFPGTLYNITGTGLWSASFNEICRLCEHLAGTVRSNGKAWHRFSNRDFRDNLAQLLFEMNSVANQIHTLFILLYYLCVFKILQVRLYLSLSLNGQMAIRWQNSSRLSHRSDSNSNANGT